jgi:hypothetical protein
MSSQIPANEVVLALSFEIRGNVEGKMAIPIVCARSLISEFRDQ